MMNMLRLLTASTAVLLVGCGAPSLGPTVASTSGCPTDGRDAAVIWSSESAPSQLDYVRGDAVVDSRALPYQGLEPAPAEAPFRQGPDAWLVANGNTTRDSTHVLRWSQADWSTTAHRVDEQVIWSVVADDDAFYTTNTVNAEAQVRRRTPDGQLTGGRASRPPSSRASPSTGTACTPSGPPVNPGRSRPSSSRSTPRRWPRRTGSSWGRAASPCRRSSTRSWPSPRTT